MEVYVRQTLLNVHPLADVQLSERLTIRAMNETDDHGQFIGECPAAELAWSGTVQPALLSNPSGSLPPTWQDFWTTEEDTLQRAKLAISLAANAGI